MDAFIIVLQVIGFLFIVGLAWLVGFVQALRVTRVAVKAVTLSDSEIDDLRNGLGWYIDQCFTTRDPEYYELKALDKKLSEYYGSVENVENVENG